MNDPDILSLILKGFIAFRSGISRLPRFIHSSKIKSKGRKMDESGLKEYCIDLLDKAHSVEPITGRDTAITQVVSLLRQNGMKHVILVGEPGVGKTALVEGLAQRMRRGEVPDDFKVTHLYSLNVGSLVGGTKYRGEFENRLKKFMTEVEGADGQIIIFIDEIHMIMGAGQVESSNIDAANLLKPYLGRGNLRFIGATTTDEYDRYILKDSAFSRRFERFIVDEPSIDEAINILRLLKAVYEKHYKLKILDGAVVAAVKYSSRYIPDQYQPAKAIALLNGACTYVWNQLDQGPTEITDLETKLRDLRAEHEAIRFERDAVSQARIVVVKKDLNDCTDRVETMRTRFREDGQKLVKLHLKTELRDLLILACEKAEECDADKDKVVDLRIDLTRVDKEITKIIADMMVPDIVGPEEVAKVISSRTGIPTSTIGKEVRAQLEGLEETLNRVIVGQEEAVKAVTNALIRSRGGPARTGEPIGSFLFAGLPGVGKTELARAVAIHFFGHEDFLVRVDMSEYMDPASGNRLIGAGPGSGGCLAERVRRNPYCVVLLDEIDKADGSVYDLLLQMLGGGRLTTIDKRTVDFTNTLIILTSNLGANYITEALTGKHTMTEARAMVEKAVKAHFRDELIDRIDELVVFKPLSFHQMLPIARLLIKDTVVGYAEAGIGLEVTDAALNHLLADVFNEVHGARQIKRMIKTQIELKLSQMRVKREIAENSRVLVHVGSKGEGLLFLVNGREVMEE